MWWAIGGAIFTCWWAFVFFIWWRGRRYTRVLSDAHVRELTLGLIKIARVATERTDVVVENDEDPRFLRSSEGIVLCYTIGRQNELRVHQLLVRHEGGPTTAAIARRVVGLALAVVDVDEEADQLHRVGDIFQCTWRRAQEDEHVLQPFSTDEDIQALQARGKVRGDALKLVHPRP